MANAFKLKTFAGGAIGANTDMTIYTGKSGTETTIIGMSIANITTSQVTVDVKIESNTSDTETNGNVELVTAAPIPAGGSLETLGGGKLVLQTTDVLRVTSDTASSLDVSLSIMEIS